MKDKQYTLFLLLTISITLISFAAITRWLDPLLQYGIERPPLTSYRYSEMYSNPGLAKNYEYNSVMVGTSMIENTNVDLCDKLFGIKLLRLPYSGGTSYNMKIILDLCFQYNTTIKYVFWELDQFQLMGNDKKARYPLPMYLYRMDHLEDSKYLLNLDIFYHYTLINIFNTIKGKKQKLERRDCILTGVFGKKQMISSYKRKIIYAEKKDFSSYKNKVDKNLKNIEDLIRTNQDTYFMFFIPPFSILYWDNTLFQGLFDVNMDALIYASERLLKYKNVKLFFYQNQFDIIVNLDNYKDYSHYGSWINNQLTIKMYQEEGLLTQDNYKTEIDKLRNYVKQYDFEQLMKEE